MIFLIIKLTHLYYRFGDGDVYLYMINQISRGIFPYKDFFIADPPGLLIFLSGIKIFLGQNWLMYQAIPSILEAINASLIYYLLRKQQITLSWLAPILYLFSFTVLSTSDYLTGVQLTIFFTLVAVVFMELKRGIAAGIFWSLAMLTKMYAFPAFAGACLYFWLTERKLFWKMVLSAFVTGIVVVLPFFFLAPKNFFDYVIKHNLNRPVGNSKATVFGFFLSYEWFLILLSLAGSFLKNSRKYVLPLVFLVVFFLLFRDLYLLYLNYLMFWFILLAIVLLNKFWTETAETRPLVIVALLVFLVTTGLSAKSYFNDFTYRNRFLNIQEVAGFLKEQNDNLKLYGTHEATPWVALLTGRELFGGYIDTNTQIFGSNTYDLQKISSDALAEGVYLLARISYYPELGIQPQGFEGYFSRELFDKSCIKEKFFEDTGKETSNYIGIYKCAN